MGSAYITVHDKKHSVAESTIPKRVVSS